MSNDAELPDTDYDALAEQIISRHLGTRPDRVSPLDGGLTNIVLDVTHPSGAFVVRIGRRASKLEDFCKEHWATNRARERGIPAPHVLLIGTENDIYPFMLLAKAAGEDASKNAHQLEIVQEMGRLTRLIHGIGTQGHGNVFDWAPATRERNSTWAEFIFGELDAGGRLEWLEGCQMIEHAQRADIERLLASTAHWQKAPSLHHGDMRTKNVLVDTEGKITAIIDWDSCISSIPPYWDLSVALHDLAIDAKEAFLIGYGIDPTELREISPILAALNILQYAGAVRAALSDDDSGRDRRLEWLRARLRGAFDLYAVGP